METGRELQQEQRPCGRRGMMYSRMWEEASTAGTESEGTMVSEEAADVGSGLTSQSLVGHGQGLGLFPGKNGKPLKGT